MANRGYQKLIYIGGSGYYVQILRGQGKAELFYTNKYKS